jgi:predicted extracellular nuclease
VAGYEAHVELLARRSLMLDDGFTFQNPDPIRYPEPGLSTDNAMRMGDTVSGLTGNIRYSRSSGGSGDEVYRLMPTVEPVFGPVNFRPGEPADVGGRIKVSCRGASNIVEYDRQIQKLVTALSTLDADIIGVNEIENDYIDEEFSSIAELVDRLNDVGSPSCGSNYDYVHPPGDVNVGDDAIAVGIIYCAGSVMPAAGTTVAMLDDSQADEVGFNAPLFNGNATSRVPLAATLEENLSGERVTVVVNHLKSKGSSGLSSDPECVSDPAANSNCDQGDGAGYWNDRRTQAAAAVADWLATDPTGAGDPDVVIVGDLNAYLMEDPITALQEAGYGNLISWGDYSYVFDGQTGTLDYGFVSSSLALAVTGVDEWHINADEADALDYNTDFGRNPSIFDGTVPYRASDHDPLLFGVDLPDTIPPVLSCNSPATIATRDHGVSFTATAVDALDDNPTVEIVTAGCERRSPSGSGTPSLCSATIEGDTITLNQLGGAKNVISWLVRASDESGNASEKECSVEVTPTGKNK